VERVPLTVVKRDGRREPYDREKLIRGLVTACRKRSVTREEVEGLVDELEAELADEYRTEVPSSELGERVLDKLAHLDLVSYVRFASVYRHFKDLDQFSKELRRLRKERSHVHTD
jgi:transcriptional repressor NrdR